MITPKPILQNKELPYTSGILQKVVDMVDKLELPPQNYTIEFQTGFNIAKEKITESIKNFSG